MSVSTLKRGALLLTAGFNTNKPADYISEQAASYVQNFCLDRMILQKRLGTVLRGGVIGGTTARIMTGREVTIDSVKYNIRIGPEKIERWNNSTQAWVDITGTDMTGGADDIIDTAVPMINGKPCLVISNGIDNIRKWTGTGNTLDLEIKVGDTIPIAKFVQEYKTYLVCANIKGGVDIDQRVQWSNTADPEVWNDGNAGATDLIEDGEEITGLNIFGDYLCVHKKSSIYLGYLVSTSAIFRFDRKNTEIGTVANKSIVNLPTGEQIFLGYDGLHLFNGVSAPIIVSPVNDEIRDNLNKEYAYKAWGVLVQEQDEVWIGIPIGNSQIGDTVYKYNYKTGVCYKDTRTNINCSWRASTAASLTWDDFEDEVTWDSLSQRWDSGQLGTLAGELHFGSSDGYVTIEEIGATADNDEAINCYWDSKDFENEEKGRMSRWLELQVFAKGSGTLKVEYSCDEGVTWNEAVGSPLTLSDVFPVDSSPQKVYFDAVSSRIRFRFSNNTATDDVGIKQFYVGYMNRELV